VGQAKRTTNVIWDLSGTLFKPDATIWPLQERTEFGLLLYLWGGTHQLSEAGIIALEILDEITPQQIHPQEELIRLSNGTLVPGIVCDWLAARISSAQAATQTMIAYKKATERTQFAHAQEVEKLLQRVFDYQALAVCMYPIKNAVEIVEQCYKSESVELYILSNWDRESFQVLGELPQGKKALDYFKPENIVISGTAGILKPHHEIFEYFINKYALDPRACILIDNQQENLAVAEKYGMLSLFFKDTTIEYIRKELTRLTKAWD
jgi:FMN phosphatase YigB (HAD superfamily)